MTKPWSKAELQEIAQLRKKGKSDSEIRGWMKTGNNRKGQCPSLNERSRPMATTKKTGKKTQAQRLTAGKKNGKKTAGRKPAAKPGRKAGGFQCGENLVVVTGQDDKFYKKFPRYAAYQLLSKKGAKGMKTSAFVDAVEKLDGVKTRGQALGILTKLLKKGCATASGVKKAA